MSNRTFATIAKHGHPFDPQQWQRVDDEHQALTEAFTLLGEALSSIEDLEPTPEDWITRIIDLRGEMQAALRGETEDHE